MLEKGAPYAFLHRLPSSGYSSTFRIDLPRRVAFALGTLCASAERTVHMLDIPLRCDSTGIAEALLQVVAMTAKLLCCISYFPLPQRWVGSRSYCVQEGNFVALAAVMTSGKNPHAKAHGYVHTCILLG